jgi:hypothetical protein
MTVKDVINPNLTFPLRRAETNEIGYRWFEKSSGRV